MSHPSAAAAAAVPLADNRESPWETAVVHAMVCKQEDSKAATLDILGILAPPHRAAEPVIIPAVLKTALLTPGSLSPSADLSAADLARLASAPG